MARAKKPYWQQLQITHCGVVATPKGGVVFAGPGGAGKSTTTFTCVRGGMNFVAEDYGILDVSTAPRMYSLYNSGKFTPQTRSFFPEIETHVQPTRESKPAKAFMYYKDLFPNQLQSSTAIKAIFVLHQAAALETSLERSTEKEALIALMPSTLYQLPYVCHEGMRRISKLVESCPVYRLSLGTDLTKIVPVVHSFFDLEPAW